MGDQFSNQESFSSSCHKAPQGDGHQALDSIDEDRIPDGFVSTAGRSDFRDIDETSLRCLTNQLMSSERERPEVEESGSGTQFVFGKMAVYLCALINSSFGNGLPIALSVMFLDWQEEFQVSRARTVAVHSTAAGILYGASLLPGYLMNRWGSRFTLLVGSALSTVGCFASYFATSIEFLIITAGVLGGLGFCFIFLPAIPAVIKAVQPKYHSIAITWCSCGIPLCVMGLPFLYRYLINRYGWRGTFVLISGICMQTFVCGLVMTAEVSGYFGANNSPVIEIGQCKLDLSTRKLTSEAEDFKEGENDMKEITNKEELHGLFDEVTNGEQPDINGYDRQIGLSHGTALHLSPGTACLRVINSINHLRSSKWKFLIDYMYILLILNLCTSISYNLSFTLVIIDFARTKGFPDDATGPFFLLVMFIATLISRLIVGPLSCIPHLDAIQLLGIFGMISSFGMIVLGDETGYTRINIFLAIHGFGAGGTLAIFPKCPLDLNCINETVYPLAFGFACSMEGICDLVIPIVIGYAVDRTGSYSTILHLLGSLSLVCSSALLVTKTYVKFKSSRNTKSTA